jgi:hypothetical protein
VLILSAIRMIIHCVVVTAFAIPWIFISLSVSLREHICRLEDKIKIGLNIVYKGVNLVHIDRPH